jgi:hypothetical protein
VKLTTTTAANESQAVAAPAQRMKCHIENATGMSPTSRLRPPVTLAGMNAAAKEIARRIQSPTEVLGDDVVVLDMELLAMF